MAKVLLIQANYDLSTKSNFPWMPLALVEIATFLNEKGHQVKILDRNIHPENPYFLAMLSKFNPDIVGMTCYTSEVIKDVRQISQLVKENSSSLVIVGGIHATLEPKSLLEFRFIDYIIRGEGEETLLDICNLIDKKKATKQNILKLNNVNYNPLRPFLNLDILPIPDYELLDVKKYPVASFYTSRGCPGRCTFCYNHGRTLRFYNTKKTIESITRVLDKYHIKEFNILDDNFANLSKRSTQICNTLSKYNSIFHCFLRADQVHDKVMSELKRAGCWIIQFGFESASQRILDFLHKDITIAQNINAVRQCKKYGFFVDGSFMIGLPTETKSELNQTLDFIKQTKPEVANIKIYKPYPSTELYEYCVKRNLIQIPKNLDEWIAFCELKQGNVNVSEIPTDYLLEVLEKYDRPSSLLTSLKKSSYLIKKGHLSYILFKLKNSVRSKL